MLTLKSYFHEVFSSRHEHKDGNREAYLPDIYSNSALLSLAQEYMINQFPDSQDLVQPK